MRLKADQNSDKTSRVCFFIPQIIYGHSQKSGGGFDFSARGVRGGMCKQDNYRLFSNETIFI